MPASAFETSNDLSLAGNATLTIGNDPCGLLEVIDRHSGFSAIDATTS